MSNASLYGISGRAKTAAGCLRRVVLVPRQLDLTSIGCNLSGFCQYVKKLANRCRSPFEKSLFLPVRNVAARKVDMAPAPPLSAAGTFARENGPPERAD